MAIIWKSHSVNRWDPEIESDFLRNKQKTNKVSGAELERSRQGPYFSLRRRNTQESVSYLKNNNPSEWRGVPWKAPNLLEFQLPGELILSLLQLLTLLDVLFLEIMDLCFHRLKLGEELEPKGEAGEEGTLQTTEFSLSPPGLKTPLPGLILFIPF